MSSKKYTTKKAFTIVEMIVSMTLMAMLMAAVAIAFNASSVNFRDNEDLFKSLNNARQTLIRLTTQLRTADPAGFDANESSTVCTMTIADGSSITYSFDADENILYLITNDDLTDGNYVMCRNVSAVNFDRLASSASPYTVDNPYLVKNVQITITVTSGATSKTLSSAIALRRNTDM
ncbi:MAG: type II secretion system protein [Anaerohalosphaera sp.]|nr:type II secretion system protein [Anaerohalosphaera sp.]